MRVGERAFGGSKPRRANRAPGDPRPPVVEPSRSPVALALVVVAALLVLTPGLPAWAPPVGVLVAALGGYLAAPPRGVSSREQAALREERRSVAHERNELTRVLAILALRNDRRAGGVPRGDPGAANGQHGPDGGIPRPQPLHGDDDERLDGTDDAEELASEPR